MNYPEEQFINNPQQATIKKNFEHDDPMELVGVQCPGGNFDETLQILIEEYIKLGFNQDRILWLFKNPFFKFTNSIFKLKGENYIKEAIEKVKKKWANLH